MLIESYMLENVEVKPWLYMGFNVSVGCSRVFHYPV